MKPRNRRRGSLGIALVVALVVLAAMALGASALMRSIDATTAIGGNLAFREASVPLADAAVEAAWAAVYETGAVADRGNDSPSVAYYASRLPGEDERGVPALLAGDDVTQRQLPALEIGEGYAVRYVIERMCAEAGPATTARCVMARARSSAAPLSTDPAAPEPLAPLLRVSIRIDGPRGTLTYAQAMIRDSTPPQRIAWRVLTE